MTTSKSIAAVAYLKGLGGGSAKVGNMLALSAKLAAKLVLAYVIVLSIFVGMTFYKPLNDIGGWGAVFLLSPSRALGYASGAK